MWAANCDFRTALEELAIDCGLLQRDGHAPVRLTPKIARPDEAALAAERGESMRWAAQVWRDARPAAGTPVETYLRARGITLAVPASLRFAPSLKYGPDGRHFPAMVAGVQDAAGAIVGVHRTYLRADGRRKADVERPKRMGGACWGGAVRFAKPAAELGIAEGIESALSVMQATGLPCWAALSLGNQRAIALPAVVTSVVLLADQDELDIDKHDKLRDAAALHHRAHGRAVRIAKPPRGKDFNDLIREGAEVSA